MVKIFLGNKSKLPIFDEQQSYFFKSVLIKIFRSKISIPISLFLLAIYAFPFYGIFKDTNSVDRHSVLILTIIMGLTLFFTAYILFGVRYLILQEESGKFLLQIKIGHFNYTKIDISTIKKIQKTRNIISSPAASMDRLEISHSKFDFVIVSPKNKTDFVHQLLLINPSIEVDLVQAN